MKFRLWHIVFCLCLLIAVIRYELLFDIIKIIYLYIQGIFSGDAPSLTSEITDYMLSAMLVIILPVISFFIRKRIKILNITPGISVSVIIIILLVSVLAPLTASFNPEFQRNIAVTKFLPPLSNRYSIFPINKTEESYSSLRNKILQNEEIEIANDVIPGKGYYQGERFITFDKPGNYIVKPLLYVFGTDELGRDIYSRIIYGTRISLSVGFLSVLIAFFTGLLLGFPAGYYEGWGGEMLNRITDMFLSFPSVFLVILILALFGNSVFTVIAVLGFTGWMSLFKIIRGEVKALKLKDYFITASAIGLSRRTLIFKEMLPVVIAPVVSNLVLLFAGVIVAEAALSYLGLGTGVTQPSWGSMIEQGQNYIDRAWWMIIIPGIFLFITIFSANNIGKQIQSYYNPVRK